MDALQTLLVAPEHCEASSRVELTAALLNPAAIFKTPAHVLSDERLGQQLKVEILCRWFYDATELSVAEEEGMGGGEPSRIGAVLAALHALTGGVDVEHVAPTKHRAICAGDDGLPRAQCGS